MNFENIKAKLFKKASESYNNSNVEVVEKVEPGSIERTKLDKIEPRPNAEIPVQPKPVHSED